MSTHFTAHVTVKRVDAEPEKIGQYANQNRPATRIVSDVAEYTVRGETLEELGRKMLATQVASVYDPEYERGLQMKREKEKREKEKLANSGMYSKSEVANDI